MNKKIMGIVTTVVVMLALIGVGIWHFIGQSTAETGGNRLGVEWYDVNGTEFTITTTEQLYEFAELSNYYDFKNQTVKLGADIIVNEGNAADWAEKSPERKWSPITGFGGVFDGQGHTISGLYASGYDAAIALFTNTMSGAKIQNFKLTNTYFESAGFGGVASISSNGGGKFKQIYSDAILNVVGTYSGFAGGICSKLNLQSSLEECWFDGVINTTGRDAAGIVDNVLGSRVTISHCLFSGEINSTWDYSGTRTGGLVGRVYKTGAGLVLNDSLSIGKINAANVYYTASVVGASMGSTSLTTTNTYGSMGSYDVAIGRSGSNGTINSAPLELREQELIGTKAYEWTNLDFDKYWAIVEGDTPILKCFAEEVPSVEGLEKAFDTSWYIEGASEYVISDLKDLYGLYFLGANNTFSGKTIKIAADIVINEGKASDWAKNEPANVWYPVSKFAGTLDGQGHTISGMYIHTSAEYVGIFKQTTMEATVKNLNVKNSYMYNSSDKNVFMGTISGRGGGTFDTIYADTMITSYGSIVGGIFGQINLEAKNTFTNCWFDGSVTMKGEAARYVGGIAAGAVKGNTTFAHCLNTGTISQMEFKDAGMFVGGIAGYIINDGCIAAITDCLNAGKINVDYHVCVGSVVGRLNKAQVTISDTYATTESYTYSDGTFRGIGTSSSGYTGGVADFPAAILSGYGGYQWTTLNFSDYWTVVVGPDGTPILKSFANKVPNLSGIAKMVDISWYSADKKEFVLKDLADLYGFYIVSGMDNFEGKTVKLGADITVNAGNAADWTTNAPANTWLPIKKFAGTFDGQGHTISGVYLKTDGAYAGLFSQTTNKSTIKNLKLTNSYLESTIVDDVAALGSIAGQMGGVLDTVYSDAIIVGVGKQIGGLVGRANRAALETYKMTNCWFDGSVKVHHEEADMAYIGGLVGTLVQGYLNMDNCLNSGTVTYTFDKLPLQKGKDWYVGVHVGGLMGGIMNGRTYKEDGSLERVSEWNVSDSLNSGLISAGKADGSKMSNGETFANGAGSVLGYTTKGTVKMDNVYATTQSCTKRTMHYTQKTASVTGGVIKISEEIISGVGAYQYTALNFGQYWAAQTNPNETPVLKRFAATVADLTGVEQVVDFSWYDANATDYTIKSMKQLYGFAVLSSADNFKGKTVHLGESITVNGGENNATGWATSAPEYEWIPISSFAGTFDGNGKTISGLYVNADMRYAGLFAQTTDTSTVKNVSIKNSYFTSTADGWQALGSVAGQMGGTLEKVYSEAIVVGTGTQIGGLVGRANLSATTTYKMTDCWFNGSVTVEDDEAQMAYIGGLVGSVVQGVLKMDNCLNTGTVSYIYDKLPLNKNGQIQGIGVHVGGLVGGIINGVSKDTGKGTKSELYITDCMNGKKIISGLKDGSKTANGAGSIFGYASKGVVDLDTVYAVNYSDTDTNVIDRTFHHPEDALSTVTGSVNQLDRTLLVGTRGYTYTTLDFTDHWAARISNIPGIKYFVTDKADMSTAWRADTSWYDDKKDSFTINTKEELYGFAQLVNAGNDFADKTVVLGKSIDVNKGWVAGSGEPTNLWSPIGNTKQPFSGIFDGNGKTIRGIYLKTDSQYGGLFGCADNSKEAEKECLITNFRLENSYFESAVPQAQANSFAALGSIAGQMGGNLTYVYSNAIVKSSAAQVGGLVGRANSISKTSNAQIKITNCWFDAGSVETTEDGSTSVGSIVGTVVQGTLTMTNCLNTAPVQSATTSVDAYVGGLVGGLMNNSSKLVINDSLNAGTVTCSAVNGVAAILGGSAKTSAQMQFANVYTTKQSISNTCYETGNNNKAVKTTESEDVKVYDDSCLTGMNGYLFTKLDFTEDWAVRTNNVPSIKHFEDQKIVAKGQKLDIDWYNENAINPATMTIDSEEELYGFAWLVNNGTTFENQTVRLGGTITITEDSLDPSDYTSTTEWKNIISTMNPWTPIGSDSNNYFAGTFDGNNNEISGLYVNATSGAAGLFGYTANSSIKNLDVKNSYMTTTVGALGSIVGCGEGTFYNVYSEAILVSDQSQIGGIIGCVQDSTIAEDQRFDNTTCDMTNCWFNGKIVSTYSADESARIGGLIGSANYGTITIANSLYSGDITCATNAKQVGGILGNDNGTNTSVVITNSVIVGTISGTTYPASVIGKISETTSASKVYVSTDVCDSTYTEGMATNITSVEKVDLSTALTNTVKVLNLNAAENNTNLTNTSWHEWIEKDGEPALGNNPAAKDDAIIDVTPTTKWYEEAKADDQGNEPGTLQNPYIISTPGDLYGLASLVNSGTTTFSGKFIQLKNDIKVNDGDAKKWAENEVNKPFNDNWTPIGNGVNAFQGTFDGQGNEITGLYLNTTRNYVGLFGYTVNSTIKNLSLTNAYFKTTATENASGNSNSNGYSIMGSIVGHGEGQLENIYSDAILVGAAGQIGGLIGRVQEKFLNGTQADTVCNITNCWFAGDITTTAGEKAGVGGLVGCAIWENTTIQNSICTADIVCNNSDATRVGGIIGYDNGTSTTVVVRNTVVAGTITGASQKGSIIGRVGKQTTVEASVYVSHEYGIGMWGELNNTDGSLIKANDTDFAAAGKLADTLLALNTAANANAGWNNWVPRDGKPVLEQFAPMLTTIDVTPDTSWLNEGDGTEANPYILIDAADLYGFAQATQNSNGNKNKFSGKIIKLGANITVNNGNAADWAITAPANASWTPIGTAGYKFSGIFDGNGCSISGIYLKTTITGGGLFGYTQCNSETDKSTVKNLRLLNSYFEYTGSDARMGSIAGAGPGNFSNIYSDAIMVSNGLYVGGIVGSADRNDTSINNFDNCWFNGTIIMKGDNGMYAGGIVGVAMKGEANISNCLNTGSISSERTAGVNVGGIVGCAHNDVKLNVTNCVNAGPFTVLSDVCVGAIVSRTGISTSKTATVTVRNSYMTGDSYTKFDIGTNGTGQTGTGHETSTYVADTTTIATSLNNNNNATVWVVKKVNGKTIPVLVTLQDLAE